MRLNKALWGVVTRDLNIILGNNLSPSNVKPRQKITSKQAEMVALGVGAIQRELKLSQLNHPCADLSLMVESRSTTKQDHSNH
jgi:hypothetical protein